MKLDMKNGLLWALLLALPLSVFGIDSELRTKGTIERVTVYRQNAKVYSKGKISIPQGKSWVVLEGLCYGIVDNSIQVTIPNAKVNLLTAMPRMNYMQQTDKSAHYNKVQDSLTRLAEDMERLQIKINALAARRAVVMENNPLHKGKESTFTLAQQMEVMNFREKQLVEIDEKQLEFNRQRKKFNEERGRLQAQLNALAGQRQKPSGEIVLQLQSSVATTIDIECNFVVVNAGWTPLYDLRSDGLDKPMRLVYKGVITQSTGIDWNKVKLKLSTANPLQNNNRPILNPNFVDLGQEPRRVYYPVPAAPRAPAPSYYMEAEEALVLEDVATSNTAGEFKRDRAAKSGGAPGGGSAPLRLNTLQTNQDNGGDDSVLEFEIGDLQDIPSDGEKHFVIIGEQDIPATYEYQTVPKLDAGAFLLAKLTDYGQYNLIPGEANLFFEGTFLGQSYIDPNVALDTLMLSLGRDEKIIIKREKLKDLTATKSLGTGQRETIVFETTIRNNKSKAVEIEVIDQFPVSKNKDLEIKLIEAKDAEVLEEIGGLRWKVKVEPNQSVKLRFSYSLKYPKSKFIVGAPK